MKLIDHVDKLPKNLVTEIASVEMEILGLKMQANGSNGLGVRYPMPENYTARRKDLSNKHKGLVKQAVNHLKEIGVST